MTARRPIVDRRTLLAGAGGLALGVGAAAVVSSATGSSAGELAAPSAGEELMIEHGFLKRILLAYRAAVDQLAAGRTPPAGAISDAAQIIADYIESFHEGLEEAYVFPRVRESNADLVRTLLVQHDKGRHLTATITTLAAAGLAPAASRAALARAMASFVRMYEPHEAWEDTVIFPALRAATPEKTLRELAERFHDLQNAQYGDGALARMLERVTGVEQQLGIANLAAFTAE